MAWLGRPKAAAAGVPQGPASAAGPVVVEPKTGAAFPLVALLLRGRAAAGPPAEEKFRCLGVGLRVKKLLVVPVRVRETRNRPYPCPRRPRGITAWEPAATRPQPGHLPHRTAHAPPPPGPGPW